MDARIVEIVSALGDWLASDEAKARYTHLTKVGIKLYDDPRQTKTKVIDLHPVSWRLVSRDSRNSQMVEATLQFIVRIQAADYRMAAVQVFNVADDVRRALNHPQAALRAGVTAVAVTTVTQGMPTSGDAGINVTLRGTITTSFSVEAL